MVLLSCNKEIQPETDSQYFDSEELTINKPSNASQGYKFKIEASETVVWTAIPEEDYSWITLDSSEGKGNGEIVYSLKANDELDARTAVITVDASSEINGFKASKTVRIVQIGTAPALLISPAGACEVSAELKEDFFVEVTSNLKWTASLTFQEGSDWARIVSGNEGENDGTIRISIDSNEEKDYRSVDLKVSNPDYPELAATLRITQQFADMKYTILFVGMTGYLPEGEYSMSVALVNGEPFVIGTTVYETEKGTVLEFSELLLPGEYRIVSLSADGGQTYDVNAPVEIIDNGVVSAIAEWDSALKLFGGSKRWPFLMDSFDNLKALQASVAAGNNYSGKYFTQTADIIMSEESWDGIGNSENKFSGVFDGNGFKIKDIYIHVNNRDGHAFFNYVAGTDEDNVASIRNLLIYGKGGEDYDIVSEDSFIAACVADLGSYSEISGCHNYAKVRCVGTTAGTQRSGTIAGNITGESILVENCLNYAEFNASNSGLNMQDCGGLIGNSKGTSQDKHVIVLGCRNYGECLFDGNTGGILGNLDECTDLVRCANYGKITNNKNSMRSGSLVGSIDVASAIKIEECFNVGEYKSLVNSGGLVGYAKGDFTVNNCYNRGNVSFSNNKTNVAGLVGHKATADGKIVNCYNASDCTATGTIAAIAGTNATADCTTSGVSGCWYEIGRGFSVGCAKNSSDVPGVAEGKDKDWFTSGTKIEGWDDSVWLFTNGSYPTLKNNPED